MKDITRERCDIMKNKYFNSIVPELITPAKVKPLVYHISLTSAYTKCPYCGAINPDEPDGWCAAVREFPDGYCRGCRKKYDDINIKTKKSKDILALEFYKELFGIEKIGGVDQETIKKAREVYKNRKK